MMRISKGHISVLIIVLSLLIDQVIKIAVKLNMYWHESIHVTDWCYIFFTENPGMAFGMEIFDKLFLTLFRIVVVTAGCWYLHKIVKEKLKMGYIICVSLIIAGAFGNIIDSVFYGVIFSESTNTAIATFMPEGGGYAPWFHGKVVDMFHFPIIDTYWPDWMPFVGGKNFVFFSPIFNFADACISCGMIALIIFYGKYFSEMYSDKKKHNEETAD
ncbi:lipoprotein signal peptidase [Bacteroides sp. 214]|uniref:lipoprotein signal peptidase n=1 Tax=Bacteroides sp. 214 TaxID=2302935 RepID=UPI0013D5D254|nr:lipoprotein signal peptidase [Bacteroides sp. 214]NDW12921.1 lipoprotein signal peptidase [Bacteroides sp. 214]